MLQAKARIIIQDKKAEVSELLFNLHGVEDGDYVALVFDDTSKNKSLPHMKYLFGVVLKTISDQHPDHPPVEGLYRFFENLYAPSHTYLFDGSIHTYVNLKGERATVLNQIIDKIIQYSKVNWGIEIDDKYKLKLPEAKEVWADAYTEQWNHIIQLQ